MKIRKCLSWMIGLSISLTPVIVNAAEIWSDSDYTSDWSSNWDWGQDNQQGTKQDSTGLYTEQWADTPTTNTSTPAYNPCVSKKFRIGEGWVCYDSDNVAHPVDEDGNRITTTQPSTPQPAPQTEPEYTEQWADTEYTEQWADTEYTEQWADTEYTEQWADTEYTEQWADTPTTELWTNVTQTQQWADVVKTPEWSKAQQTGQWADVIKTKEWEELQQTPAWKTLESVETKSWLDASALEYPPGEVSFDTPPVVENGRTLVPIRTILDLTGAQVDWDSTTRTVTAKKGDMTIALIIGSKTALVNNKPVALDVPAKIKDGRTLVPLRFITESLGYKVDYDNATRKVTLDNKWYFSTDPKTYANKPAPSTSKPSSSNNSGDLIYGGLNDAQWNAMKIYEKYGLGSYGLNYYGQSGF